MIEPAPVRQRLRALWAAVLLVAAISCDDPTGSVPAAAVGTYTLARVNDQPLPVRITDTPELRVDIVAGAMVVRSDGTYRETRQSQLTDADGTRTGGSFTEGTLHVSGMSLEVRERAGGTYSGTYSESGITYTVPAGATSVSFTYVKD